MGISYNTSVVRDGLVLYLDAANPKSYTGSDILWKDLSGNGNNGTLVNGVGYSPDNKGSMIFDGVNDFIDTSYMPPTGTNPRTISIWFKANALQNKNLLGYGTGSMMRMWDVLLLNTGVVGVHLFQSGAEASAPYQVGQWQNVVFAFTYPTITSYMNGEQKNSHSRNDINTGETNTLSISKGVFSTYHYFNRSVSTVQVYNRALTDAEIRQNYEATRGRYLI
jgi:hypothetical protein